MSTPSGSRKVSVEHAIAFGLLTALGLAALVVALGYGLFKEGNRVGPGLVPAVVGAGIALIAGWEFVSTLLGRRASHTHGIAEVAASVTADASASPAPAGGAGAPPPLDEATAGGGTATPSGGSDDGSDDEDDDEDLDIFGRSARTRSRQLVVVFVALVVAVLLIPVLGFLVSFFLLSVFISTIVERRAWLPSVVVSLVAVLVVYAVFALFLNVPLPTGLTGIGG